MPDVEYRPFDEPLPDDYECDPVGVIEIADRLGVEARSVHMMGRRGTLPPPDWDSINGYRAWNWPTVLWWAGETGRLRTDALVKQYRRMFGQTEPDLAAGRKPNGMWNRVDSHAHLPKVPGGRKKAAAK